MSFSVDLEAAVGAVPILVADHAPDLDHATPVQEVGHAVGAMAGTGVLAAVSVEAGVAVEIGAEIRVNLTPHLSVLPRRENVNHGLDPNRELRHMTTMMSIIEKGSAEVCK